MPSLLYSELSGHDAQLESVAFDPVAETVTIDFMAYETEHSSNRIAISIQFKSVTSISTVMGFENLALNRGAGNVAYWEIATTAGISFIHLTGGTIAITSKAMPTLVDRSK